MSRQLYRAKSFGADSVALIDVMNVIVEEYVEAGYRLTVRQLYYQLVARDIVENTERSYKRVTSIVNDAKLAGLMDWEAIEDRTREFIRRTRWESAAQIVRASADSFHMDMWEDQPKRVFVIVEKEALAGVLERACKKYDVPLLAARGYPSGTVLREFCQSDLIPALEQGQEIAVLHLGDHDPSGIDMTRDLADRIALFGEDAGEHSLDRIALTMEQIRKQKPPPNPAKSTDARFASYRARFGVKSWELDALKPEFLDALVGGHIAQHIHQERWNARSELVEEIRARISKTADEFENATS